MGPKNKMESQTLTVVCLLLSQQNDTPEGYAVFCHCQELICWTTMPEAKEELILVQILY